MNTILTEDPLSRFPIAGKTVCDALAKSFRPEDRLVLRDIETLCSTNCQGLGDLWQRTVASRSELVTAGELIEVLAHADQVICLDVRGESDPSRVIFIEDGELVDNTLQM